MLSANTYDTYFTALRALGAQRDDNSELSVVYSPSSLFTSPCSWIYPHPSCQSSIRAYAQLQDRQDYIPPDWRCKISRRTVQPMLTLSRRNSSLRPRTPTLAARLASGTASWAKCQAILALAWTSCCAFRLGPESSLRLMPSIG